MAEHTIDFSALKEASPPIISRQKAQELLGGMISAKTLQNLDSLGDGPAVRVRMGGRKGKVGYPRNEFIAWVQERIQVIK